MAHLIVDYIFSFAHSLTPSYCVVKLQKVIDNRLYQKNICSQTMSRYNGRANEVSGGIF
jgi:hypothetical protein